jgi:hypothetical protein
MKHLLHIATADDGTELNIGRDGDDVGMMITVSLGSEPLVDPDDPKWIETKFGKEAVEEAHRVLDYLKFKSGQDNGKELFESITPDILKVINDLKQEEDSQ